MYLLSNFGYYVLPEGGPKRPKYVAITPIL